MVYLIFIIAVIVSIFVYKNTKDTKLFKCILAIFAFMFVMSFNTYFITPNKSHSVVTSDTIKTINKSDQRRRILFCSDKSDTLKVIKEYQKYGKYCDDNN